MTPDRIGGALGGRRSGRGWSARCPLHGDRHASLSLWIDEQGRLAVHCHAGCPDDELVAHLRRRGLWCERTDPVRAAANAAAYERQRREEARTLWRESVAARADAGRALFAARRAIAVDPGAAPALALGAVRARRARHAIRSPTSRPACRSRRSTVIRIAARAASPAISATSDVPKPGRSCAVPIRSAASSAGPASCACSRAAARSSSARGSRRRFRAPRSSAPGGLVRALGDRDRRVAPAAAFRSVGLARRPRRRRRERLQARRGAPAHGRSAPRQSAFCARPAAQRLQRSRRVAAGRPDG